jgi:uncharacterized membrane protein YccC
MVPEDRTPDDLAAELRALGANLKEVLKAAWESEERRRLQTEIGSGLEDLASTLKSAAQEFSESPTGQRLKADVQDARERLRKGQVEGRMREDMLAALRKINAELSKAAARRSSEDDSSGPAGPA